MSEQLVPQIRFDGSGGEWVEREVGSLGAFLKGNGYSKADVGSGRIPLFLYGRLYTNYQLAVEKVNTFAAPHPNSVVSRGDEVLVPSSGETPEDIAVACALLESGVLLGGDLNVIRPNAQTDSTFLALSLSHGKAKDALSKRAQGKSVVHLRNSDLRALTIQLPGISEQKAIGSLFADLDASIDQHRRRHQQLQQAKASLMERMFPAPGETEPQIRFDGFDGEWNEDELGAIADMYQPETISGRDFVEYGFPVFGANGYIGHYSEANHWEDQVTVSARGAVGIPSYVPAPVWITGNSMVIRVSPSKRDKRFLYYSLQAGRAALQRVSAGGVQQQLTREVLRTVRVSGPSLPEQKAIGSLFAKLDALIEAEQHRVDKLQQTKASLLQKMFV